MLEVIMPVDATKDVAGSVGEGLEVVELRGVDGDPDGEVAAEVGAVLDNPEEERESVVYGSKSLRG